jgi:hypothetical protein
VGEVQAVGCKLVVGYGVEESGGLSEGLYLVVATSDGEDESSGIDAGDEGWLHMVAVCLG